MIELVQGNLLEADAEALVNTVNCVGVMGKGIALQFRQAFPDNFNEYAKACREKRVRPGQMLVVQTNRLVNPRYIINFPTKRHWKGRSRMEDIEAGLAALVREVRRIGIKSVAIPPLGCGNGGLDWALVKPLIEGALGELNEVRVFLYAPTGTPPAEVMPVHTPKPELTRARAMLLLLLDNYLIPGYRLSLLEIQKLAYFLQQAGEPLKLNFGKQKYGPYAENLNHVLQRLEGHYIRGYGDRSQNAEIRLVPGVAEAARIALPNDLEIAARLERVRRLIQGFETPYGLELLATVHWVAVEDPAANFNPEEAVRKVQEWNARKSALFNPEHARKAWRRLQEQGWLPSPVASSVG